MYCKQLFILVFLFIISSNTLQAQTTITGKVVDAGANTPLPGVNIRLKDAVAGTISSADGSFLLNLKGAPPFKIIFSFVGYSSQEIALESGLSNLEIKLEEKALLGEEVVIAASRVEESILQAPVTIEKMDVLQLRNTPAADFYSGIGNLKGIDVVASSINFPVFNMRGFGSASNNRTVQLLDGMDTQIPSLNLSAANIFGPSELDIESMEILPGASSALYGPNAFNGIILQTTKNAFDYQGLSAFAKMGVNHIDDSDLDSEGRGKVGPGSAQPMYEAALRYAKAFNNRFAFKVSLSYSTAKDWYGTSFKDRAAIAKPQGFSFNPGADLIFSSGDEVATSLGLVRFSLAANPAFQSSPLAPLLQFLPNHTVARTGYDESSFVDYNTYNAKVNTSLHYRIHDNLEVSYMLNYGKASSVFNAAQRTIANGFSMQQHKLELKSDHYFVRAYFTRPDLGETYSGDLTGVLINNAWKPHAQWFQEYSLAYLTNVATQITQPGYDPNSIAAQEAAHQFARAAADQGRLVPGTPEFEAVKRNILSNTIPNGSAIKDNTSIYHAEAQYDFKKLISFVSLQAGASYRLFDLQSNGTIFSDTAGRSISIQEVGAYVQATKNVLNDKLKITGSLRYDKNENFDAQINPRIGLVYSPVHNHNIRVAYQTGFRNPTVQGQHVNFNAVSLRLLGGLPEYAESLNVFENAYSLPSVQKFIAAVAASGSPAAIVNPANQALLERVEKFKPIVPEEVQTIEIGYKSMLTKNLFMDVAYFYNQYNNFLAQRAVRKASGLVSPTNPQAAQSLLSAVTTPGSENTFSIHTNVDQQISSQGFVGGVEYSLPRNFVIGGNYNWNKLNEELDGFNTDFNTPEHKFNVTFSNRKLTQNLGFSVAYRWQEAFLWESTFAKGEVPSFGMTDAQVSYAVKPLKSIVKIGGSNIFNERYFPNYGSPTLGGIYYISITFNP
jgi:iron complex outermembrane recepter protein